MSDISSGFPRNLAYSIKKLDAGFSKTKVKILPDIGSSGSVSQNGIIRFRLTGNSIYDFRTLCMYFTGSATKTSGNNVHFPRYSASLIENISITANNTTLCSINQYNLLYNMLMDLEGSDISQIAKRDTAGERHDPSVSFSCTLSNGPNDNPAIVYASNVAGTTASDTDVLMCINNWLGLLGSMSTPCPDLSDLGDLYINIQLAPASCLFAAGNGTVAATAVTTDERALGASYSLKDIFLTIDRCSFQDPLYYSLKTEKLLSPEGLNIAYYDYYTTQFSRQNKSSTGINLNWNVNSASLDQVLVTLRHKNFDDTQVHPLIIHGGNDQLIDNNKTFRQIMADPSLVNDVGTLGNSAYQDNLGDAFNNSLYFVRNGLGLKGSKFQINNIDIDPYNLTPLEVYNKVLQYTGFQNLDLGSAGLHGGCMSYIHFLKYYFTDICDLTNITTDNQFYISGLDGRGTGINITYNCQFDTVVGQVAPVAFCRNTKVLNIHAGRQLVIDPV